MEQVGAQGAEGGAEGGAISVVLVGHSYVRRLAEYMDCQRPRLVNMELAGVEVHCVGIGGATLRPGDRCIRRHLAAVSAYRPTFIYLHIGENDLGRMPDYQITNEILAIAHDLAALCTRHVVIIGQLVPFLRTRHQHEQSVAWINVHLREQMPPPRLLASPVRLYHCSCV